jgi:MerR family transcriptional regulator/heat shock protein HspR
MERPIEQTTHIVIHNLQTPTYYSEQELADYCHLEVQVIRQLHGVGIIQSIEIAGEAPRYGEDAITVLRRARRLYYDLGVNLEGIEIILRLQARLEALQRELEQYRHEKSR